VVPDGKWHGATNKREISRKSTVLEPDCVQLLNNFKYVDRERKLSLFLYNLPVCVGVADKAVNKRNVKLLNANLFTAMNGRSTTMK
jgi:hypothetical protein